jgi:CBS domain-containing protein
MADLSLPILDRTASGEEALAAMKEHGRSGVIVQRGKRFWLYGAGHGVLALADNSAATLEDIKPTIELYPSGTTR